MASRLLPPARPRHPVPFVTIGFSADLPLLRLQARSFARHLAVEHGRRIYVVNNDQDAGVFAAAFGAEVLPEYGPHAHQVTLVPREACLPGFDELKGWRRQQLLKWAMSSVVDHGLYLTLDCKNVLVRPWCDADLFTEEGQIRLARRGLRDKFLPSFLYFVDKDEPRPEFVSNIVTPYTLSARLVQEMLREIAAREPVSAFRMLAEEPAYYEYALYWSYVVARGAAWMYDLTQPPLSGGFWFKDHENVDDVLATLGHPSTAWAGVHRNIAQASAESQARVAAFLVERGLFTTTQDALDNLARFDSSE